jgi:hypothetical protein
MDRIDRIEERLARQEKIIRKTIERIGLNMEDFNFDDLLDEIDESETAIEATEATPEPAPEPEPAPTNTIADLDSLIDEPDEPAPVAPVTPVTPTPKTTQVEEISYDTTGVEFAEEYVKYFKERNDKLMQKKAFMDEWNEDVKAMDDEYEDIGVDTKVAKYVENMYKKQMNETAEQTKLFNAMEKMMKKDDSLKRSFDQFID